MFFTPSLTGDLNALRLILLYHFSNGIFINGGLEVGVTNLLKTIQGSNLQVLSVSTTTTEDNKKEPIFLSLSFLFQIKNALGQHPIHDKRESRNSLSVEVRVRLFP